MVLSKIASGIANGAMWVARHPMLVPLLVQGLQEVLADRTHTNPMGQVVNALLPFANLPRCINCFRTWILSRVFRREVVDETEQDLSYDDIKEYFQSQGAFRPCLGMCRHGDVLGEGLVEHEPVRGWNPPQRKRESAFKDAQSPHTWHPTGNSRLSAPLYSTSFIFPIPLYVASGNNDSLASTRLQSRSGLNVRYNSATPGTSGTSLPRPAVSLSRMAAGRSAASPSNLVSSAFSRRWSNSDLGTDRPSGPPPAASALPPSSVEPVETKTWHSSGNSPWVSQTPRHAFSLANRMWRPLLSSPVSSPAQTSRHALSPTPSGPLPAAAALPPSLVEPVETKTWHSSGNSPWVSQTPRHAFSLANRMWRPHLSSPVSSPVQTSRHALSPTQSGPPPADSALPPSLVEPLETKTWHSSGNSPWVSQTPRHAFSLANRMWRPHLFRPDPSPAQTSSYTLSPTQSTTLPPMSPFNRTTPVYPTLPSGVVASGSSANRTSRDVSSLPSYMAVTPPSSAEHTSRDVSSITSSIAVLPREVRLYDSRVIFPIFKWDWLCGNEASVVEVLGSGTYGSALLANYRNKKVVIKTFSQPWANMRKSLYEADICAHMATLGVGPPVLGLMSPPQGDPNADGPPDTGSWAYYMSYKWMWDWFQPRVVPPRPAPALVFDFVPGSCTFQDVYTAGNKYEMFDVLDMLIQLVHLLAFIHRIGYLHNDLKGNNVLIALNPVYENRTTPVLQGPPTPGGLSSGHKYRVYLLDFGNTTYQYGYRYELSDEVKANHALCPYLAPEVVMGQSTSYSSDVFSLGMLIHQFVTFYRRAVYIDKLVPLVEECLKENPEERPSMEDVEEDLCAIWNRYEFLR